jgi:hypothetical protein
LRRFRAAYPHTTIVLVSDNGYNYSRMAAYFGAIYIHEDTNAGPCGKEDDKIRVWLDRLCKGMALIKEEFCMLLEDDVNVVSRYNEPFTGTINGNFVNKIKASTFKNIDYYSGVVEDKFYTGHGGSVFNIKELIAILGKTDNRDWLINNWTKLGPWTSIDGDIMLCLMTLTNGGTVCQLHGHKELYTNSRDLSGAAVIHQCKEYYNTANDEALDCLYDVMETATCITAVYDIGRTGVDGRTMSDYKKWLLNTVAWIETPFVLFLDKSLDWRAEILAARAGKPIGIIQTPIDEIPMWGYISRISDIIQEPLTQFINPKDITNIIPEYVLIQYSKLEWLKIVANFNPFNSSQFVWIDAGFSRFMKSGAYRFKKNTDLGVFNIQADVGRIEEISKLTYDTYIGTNRRILAGDIFVTDIDSLTTVKTEVMRIWDEEMIGKRRHDNEQIALALACKNIPETFNLVSSGAGGCNAVFEKFFEMYKAA